MMFAATALILCVAGVPVFKGFEGARYQKHDAIIAKCVKEFNRHRGAWADANRNQAKTIPDITDADAKVSSLRTYLVASVMRRQNGRLNMVTAGFNRNVFRFA